MNLRKLIFFKPLFRTCIKDHSEQSKCLALFREIARIGYCEHYLLFTKSLRKLFKSSYDVSFEALKTAITLSFYPDWRFENNKKIKHVFFCEEFSKI